MSGFSPSFVLRKLIVEPSSQGIAQAEDEFKLAVLQGLPDIAFSSWPAASLDDWQRPIRGIRYHHDGTDLVVSYLGTHRIKLGSMLSFTVDYAAKAFGDATTPDIACLSRMLSPAVRNANLVGIGQNANDLRAGGYVLGTRPAVAMELLAAEHGLCALQASSLPYELVRDLLGLLVSVLGYDEVVSIPHRQRRAFLLECFSQLTSVISPSEFEMRFSSTGIAWPRRSWINRLLG